MNRAPTPPGLGVHLTAVAARDPMVPSVDPPVGASHHDRRKTVDLDGMEMTKMKWYHAVAYFFGGMILANAIPHTVMGVCGQPMQTPFASPPGQGLSSPLVNVLWGMANLVLGYLLVARVGAFDLRRTTHVLALGAGLLAMAVMLARTFGKLHGF